LIFAGFFYIIPFIRNSHGNFSHCRNTFVIVRDLMMGLIGKPELCTKFKIASFSHCILSNFGTSRISETADASNFNKGLGGEIKYANLVTGMGHVIYLKSILSAIAYILKENPQIIGSSPSPGPRLLFLPGGIL